MANDTIKLRILNPKAVGMSEEHKDKVYSAEKTKDGYHLLPPVDWVRFGAHHMGKSVDAVADNPYGLGIGGALVGR